MSEKSVLNGLSFYTGLKLEKNNCLYACLYCSNDYEFSGIKIDYSFKINNFKEKNFNYVFRHFGAGFKKLIKNPIECKKRLVTRITIKNLNNRTSIEEKIERKLKLNINERCKTRSIKPKVMSLIEFNQIDSNYFHDDKDCMGHDDYSKL
ncbi:hypothetical protein BpHYR1_054034 [Brachionus plicatilis]|uniref:Uncharacterized protein n=1 Tax=Brachionus plicatilis TaxID=10195 RepID=A0A3M7QFZ6_BRAPC|nr:hypothetical protein BpHYR1_054034 [Brachionus plicatilis]